jgi:GH24 family phage-related lysozyme (muramidase)
MAAAPAGATPTPSAAPPSTAGLPVRELAALIQKSGAKNPAVQAAVKAFQAAAGLHADGIYGPQTRAALVGAGALDAPAAFFEPLGSAPAPSASPASASSSPSAAAGASLAMHPSVLQAFEPFSTKFEGFLPYMYLDIKGLVTTGMGNLIDPIGEALRLPWKRPDGSLASQDEIRAAWNAVKARTDLAPKFGQAFAGVTTLRLDKEGIEQLIARRLKENEDYLRTKFPGYGTWPADAQLGLHSMAWAMGPGFKFPAFEAAVNREPPDFHAAAAASHMNDAGNPGLTSRNKANFELFTNAARVLEQGGDPSTLYWPGDVLGAAKAAAQQAAGAIETAAAQAASTVRRHGVAPFLVVGGVAAGIALVAAWVRHSRTAREAAP